MPHGFNMARKDITDKQVCEAYVQSKEPPRKWPYQILAEMTGQVEKVCFLAMERAEHRGYIDCGVSLRSGWLTAKGLELLLETTA